MAGCGLLAVVYWLLTLRCALLRRIHRTVPLEGITAGELRTRLIGSGADLSLMVVSWAQLGYLYIDRDDNGRIFLRKRMDMGNERSGFENRCFRSLFAKKRFVDGTGYHYAQLCMRVAEESANPKGQYLRSSGNPGIPRILACILAASAGSAMGIDLASAMTLRIAIAAVLGILGAVSAWMIQRGCRCLHLRGRRPAHIGLGCCCAWLVMAWITDSWKLAIPAVLFQILVGFAVAYGGRRTPSARQTAGEILGLRHYLRTVSRQELQRICKANPNYYYELAPYALALGVDRAFARRFGRMKQPGCPYLVTGIPASNALHWYPQLRAAVNTLDSGHRQITSKHR